MRMFQGFAYPLQISDAAGRIAAERDYERYVRNLIYQVLLTRPGERINRPTFGGGVRSLVFAPLSEETASIARTAIQAALTEWLDAFIAVEEIKVEVTPPSTLTVTVIYLIRQTNERRFLNVEVAE
jgi:uncharacterized protein